MEVLAQVDHKSLQVAGRHIGHQLLNDSIALQGAQVPVKAALLEFWRRGLVDVKASRERKRLIVAEGASMKAKGSVAYNGLVPEGN